MALFQHEQLEFGLYITKVSIVSVQEPMRTTIPAIVNSYPKNVGNQARVQAYWEGNETINKINIILQSNEINAGVKE